MRASYVAFIPVRGGSKSIPLKNIRHMAGKPLVLWTVEAALACPSVDRVVVSTDSPEIEAIVTAACGDAVEIHRRSAINAGDTASTESVMLEYAQPRDDFDNMVLIQATSPLLTADDLERGLALHASGRFDSVLSAVRQKRFIWADEGDGAARPVNYDFTCRPRRQEFDGFFVENGAFYVTSRASLLANQCRLGGSVGLVEMDEETYFEIDEPSDWTIVEGLLAVRGAAPAPADGSAHGAAAGPAHSPAHSPAHTGTHIPHLAGIKALFTDCDGVLTDGGMYYSESGDELKRFITKDGLGFALLRERGLITGIITSESVDLVRRRAAKLKLDECILGAKEKLAVIDELCEKYAITRDEIAYVGDDLMDIPVIEAVGFGCCPADGMTAARDAADYVTVAKGGFGAVREVADLIIAARER